MSATTLPAGFEALENLAPEWALATQNQRHRKRLASSREELRRFYDATLPHLEKILAHLDAFPLGGLPPDAARLSWIALSLAEVAPHIELYGGDPGVPHSFEETRFIAEHGERAG